MKTKWILFAVVGAAFFYFFLYYPPLPTPGTTGKIGKKFTGTWDGSNVILTSAVTNQADTDALFSQYPQIKTITDSGGLSFTRS